MSRIRRTKHLKNKPASKAKVKKTNNGVFDGTKIGHPTPEMQARVRFELGQVINETGQRIGLAYRRTPLWHTMALSGAFSPDETSAMHYYRTAFDRMERSAVRSCLNISTGGGGSATANLFHTTPSMVDAKRKVQICESRLGPALNTMRGVVLHDLSLRELAMQRFGSRITQTATGTKTVSPKSGRHKEVIRQEFRWALQILTDEVRHLITTGTIEEVWVKANADGSASIYRSLIAPAGSYRCWGDNTLVDRVLLELRETYGASLHFTSPVLAIEALKGVEIARFRHLEPEELAA